MSEHDVVITGIGIISSLGEGPQAHWAALTAERPARHIDAQTFAPYRVHPLQPVDWGLQIPKRGDQRQMEAWQRLGTYAAGLALDDADLKNNEALCATMDMIVAAGGGERDAAVDTMIMDAALASNSVEVLLNEKLTTELRPTLFLAQLSNLMAGNISIVHKVTGSSRTFMGEEGSGVSAVETAVARIRSGQSTHVLVGGAFHTEHPDHLLGYELNGLLHKGEWAPVWSRGREDGGGVITGSGAAFLILESRAHADRRGRKSYAAIERIVSDNVRRSRQDLAAEVGRMLDDAAQGERDLLVVTGASGAHDATAAEKTALDARSGLVPRAFCSVTGHMKEAQFPFAIALAALAISNGSAYPPFDPQHEKAGGPSAKALATAIGAMRYEGVALVGAA